MDFTISNLRVLPLKESKFVKPFSILYTQDGKEKRWDCVEAHDSVSCLLYHREFDSFLFVRQFRPSVWHYQDKNQIQNKNGLTYELCAGIMDKGLDAKATMIEEIMEETGYSIDNIERVTSSFTALGFGANCQVLFYAQIDESMKLGLGGGIDDEKIEYMLELRASGNDICKPYADEFPGAVFVAGRKPWEVKCDIALPCATQNELNGDDARMLIANGVTCVAEVSNMGCTAEAAEYFVEQKAIYAPGKAVNAGGVATSGLEMTQNSMRLGWSEKEVDEKLHYIMSSIHDACVEYGKQPDGYIDYVKGANIAGFMKVAKAMMAQGVV